MFLNQKNGPKITIALTFIFGPTISKKVQYYLIESERVNCPNTSHIRLVYPSQFQVTFTFTLTFDLNVALDKLRHVREIDLTAHFRAERGEIYSLLHVRNCFAICLKCFRIAQQLVTSDKEKLHRTLSTRDWSPAKLQLFCRPLLSLQVKSNYDAKGVKYIC